ncbi:MAG: hypothetical protein ACREGR_02935, partial [Minisyncoccia bacterium]
TYMAKLALAATAAVATFPPAMLGGSVENHYRGLKGWDMSIVKRYAVQKGVLTAEEIDTVEGEYHRFLALTLAYPKTRIPVAGKVDLLWHTHILFTNDYSDMAKALGVSYIHHRPGILDESMDMDAEFAEKTVPLYELHFGPADRSMWCKALCCSSSQGCSGNHVAGDHSGHINN